MNFEGTYVAMVTPFTKDLEIDEEGFRSNINYLIDQGVNGLVGAGTTSESATVNHEEHQKIIDILVDEADGVSWKILSLFVSAETAAQAPDVTVPSRICMPQSLSVL